MSRKSSQENTSGLIPTKALTALHRIERETLEDGRNWTRVRLQERLQAEADRLGPISPYSGLKLKRAQRIRMGLRTVSGPVEIRVWYGFCRLSNRPVCPARESWNMAPYQQLSPEFEQRLCYTASETGSFEKAARMANAWGSTVIDDAIHACSYCFKTAEPPDTRSVSPVVWEGASAMGLPIPMAVNFISLSLHPRSTHRVSDPVF